MVCLLPHASQWNLPDTVVPAIEKSQKNIVLNLILACLHDSRMSDITDSTTVSLMHCALSLTVCKCTPCQRASFNSTTDSFSWGHDPYTLACKARPSFDGCGTSLSVSLSMSLPSSMWSGQAHLYFHGGRCPVSLRSVIGELSRENLVLLSFLGKTRWSRLGHCHDTKRSQVRRVCVWVLCSFLMSGLLRGRLFGCVACASPQSSVLGDQARSYVHGCRFPVSLRSVIGELSRENLVLPPFFGKLAGLERGVVMIRDARRSKSLCVGSVLMVHIGGSSLPAVS